MAQNVWYLVRTAVNNREPLFCGHLAPALFFQVLREANDGFPFELRALRLQDEALSFYIKPACGFRLPAIMQWLKQTFAVRFNRRTGRSGHIWGDRYWSSILEGEPPEGAEVVDWAAVAAAALPVSRARIGGKSPGVSPRKVRKPAKSRFSPKIPFRSPFPPG